MLDISQRERDCTIVEVVKLFTHQHSWLFNPSILRCRGEAGLQHTKRKTGAIQSSYWHFCLQYQTPSLIIYLKERKKIFTFSNIIFGFNFLQPTRNGYLKRFFVFNIKHFPYSYIHYCNSLLA